MVWIIALFDIDMLIELWTYNRFSIWVFVRVVLVEKSRVRIVCHHEIARNWLQTQKNSQNSPNSAPLYNKSSVLIRYISLIVYNSSQWARHFKNVTPFGTLAPNYLEKYQKKNIWILKLALLPCRRLTQGIFSPWTNT